MRRGKGKLDERVTKFLSLPLAKEPGGEKAAGPIAAYPILPREQN